ncbi:MAG: YfhO family protein [Marinifilaceae bacterium]|jgi:hypothetical protein|nr:YfhO family protein [Marinifilaceae bacterium]
MNFKAFFKKSYPHLIAVAVFVLVSIIYFSPVLNGERMQKSDTINAIGYKKEITDFKKKTGEDPLWTNSMFGGMPAYHISVDYVAKKFHVFSKILYLNFPSPVRYLLLYMIGFYILMIALRVRHWLAIAGSIAFAFSSYFVIIILAGHLWKVYAIAFLPPLLGGIVMTLRGRYIVGGLITSLFMILEILANHIQMTYYFVITVICVLIFDFISKFKNGEIKAIYKSTTVLIVASVFALLVNSSNLFNTYQYSKQTIRGKSELTLGDKDNKTTGVDKDYGTAWSYGIQETLSLLIPNVKGGGGSSNEAGQILNYVASGNLQNAKQYYELEQTKNNHYWGNQIFTVGPVYIGAVILFFFFLGLFILRSSLVRGLLAATILSILLSWGHHFMFLTGLFFDYFPLYNKFRAVSSILIIAELCIPIISVLCIKKLIESPSSLSSKLKIAKFNIPILSIPTILTAGVAGILLIMPTSFLDFFSDNEIMSLNRISDANPNAVGLIAGVKADLLEARLSIFRADCLRTIAFVVLSLGLSIAFAKKYLKATYFCILIGILVLVDLVPVNKRWVNNSAFVPAKQLDIPYSPSYADMQILNWEMGNNQDLTSKIIEAQKQYRKDNRRASKLELAVESFSTLNLNSNYRVFNKTVNTFSNASTSYFHKSIGGYHGAKLRRYQDLIDYHISKGNQKVLNMLNTKYIIMPDKEKGSIAIPNIKNLGYAWFVSKYKIVENANEEILALNQIDPKKELVLDKRFDKFVQSKFDSDSLATIKMLSYAPNKIKYELNTRTNQIAVFSEIYYQPGWNSYLDGKKVDHFRVNYALRAMNIEKGKHIVEFKFEPSNFYLTEKISIFSMLLFLVLAISVLVYAYKKDLIFDKRLDTELE